MIRIRYYLSLPAETTRQNAEKLLKKLRQFCLDKPFNAVSSFVSCSSQSILQNEAIDFPNQCFKQVVPKTKMGFTCLIGGETARQFHLYLYKYPDFLGTKVPWFFDGCCWVAPKTPEHEFLTLHLAVIAALDHAKELGFEIEVKDGGAYWKNRNRKKLLGFKKAMEPYPDAQLLFDAVGKINNKLEEI
jgi:hypothetical protein